MLDTKRQENDPAVVSNGCGFEVPISDMVCCKNFGFASFVSLKIIKKAKKPEKFGDFLTRLLRYFKF